MSETKSPPDENSSPQFRIIRKSTCPSLSEKSSLTYAIGCKPDRSIHLRISANSGGGLFSQEWISLEGILNALKSREKQNTLTSICLVPLFKRKSVNTPAFLLAVLVAEKLVKPLPDRKRLHQLCDPADFIGRMEKLIDSGVNLPDDSVASTPKATSSSASKPSNKPRTLSRKKPS